MKKLFPYSILNDWADSNQVDLSLIFFRISYNSLMRGRRSSYLRDFKIS